MSSSSVWKILAGTTRRVRASTARRIFAVDVSATADGSRIDARPTWVLVRQMVAAGFTKAELGLRLGHVIPKLDLGRKLVRARTAHLIRRLHAEVMGEREAETAGSAICRDCGLSHAPGARQKAVRRMLPCSAADLREAHPCWWAGIAGDRALYRDLRAVGAVRAAGRWAIPERRAA